MGKNYRGFTIIELLVMLAIIGILAVMAIPRFSSSGQFIARPAAEILVADIRYAQALALKQGTNKAFTIQANGYAVGTSDKTVTFGTGDYANFSGVSLSGTTFSFDRKGNASMGQNITVSASGTSVTVTVTDQTGRVAIQ